MRNDVLLQSSPDSKLLYVRSSQPAEDITVTSDQGGQISAPVLKKNAVCGNYYESILDTCGLTKWSPESPVLYTIHIQNEKIRFGLSSASVSGSSVLVNGLPYYFRGYIRGIPAHDHPNLTGLSDSDFFRKNIIQAKKYGFNLVRFHSTIPDPLFVEAADELGLFIHLEVGYNYEFDAQGKKKKIVMNEALWRSTLISCRNHPSVLIFCIGNEMHKCGNRPEVRAMYEIGRELAPNKLIMDNSGWGEYDRTTADIFSQHIAYYFPYKKHADMFNEDFCWRNNGSVSGESSDCSYSGSNIQSEVARVLTPIRPVLAHEAVHYIDIPDYEALNRKYDSFAAAAGQAYLDERKITKPRYLTELPELIKKKNLKGKMKDYIAGSQHWKKMAIKTYIERLRLCETICGFEMLQFSHCLKYENKNGIVDFFDDDTYIESEWMRSFNDQIVLLSDFTEETMKSGSCVDFGIYLSQFSGNHHVTGSLKIFLSNSTKETEIFSGGGFILKNGLAKLTRIQLTLKTSRLSEKYTVRAIFTHDTHIITNCWDIWVYREGQLTAMPVLALRNTNLTARLKRMCPGKKKDTHLFITDVFNQKVIKMLGMGKTVLLNYHRDNPGHTYYLPGTLDRFKPCIWDRGSNLGGFCGADWVQKALGTERYFDKNFYHLIEEGYKVNLDKFPFRVNEIVSGIDKPVRDRMKGLIHKIKDFIPDDTLRNFCYLFSMRVGRGLLIVNTFNLTHSDKPAVQSYLSALINNCHTLHRGKITVAPDEFIREIKKITGRGHEKEDVMNHFWEIDNKPVEDTLFWEAAKVDLSKMSPH